MDVLLSVQQNHKSVFARLESIAHLELLNLAFLVVLELVHVALELLDVILRLLLLLLRCFYSGAKFGDQLLRVLDVGLKLPRASQSPDYKVYEGRDSLEPSCYRRPAARATTVHAPSAQPP